MFLFIQKNIGIYAVLYIYCVCIVFKLSSSCVPNEFDCLNGQCIPNQSICDGFPDCDGNLDETQDLCSNNNCSSATGDFVALLHLLEFNQFRCNYGACIPHLLTCDGTPNCIDGSDETAKLCKRKICPQNTFKCEYGGCIKSILSCNGVPNCVDGSDETRKSCRFKRCSHRRFFQCDYGACIGRKHKCDGKKDCIDGSDENPSTCPNYATTTTTTDSMATSMRSTSPSTMSLTTKFTTTTQQPTTSANGLTDAIKVSTKDNVLSLTPLSDTTPIPSKELISSPITTSQPIVSTPPKPQPIVFEQPNADQIEAAKRCPANQCACPPPRNSVCARCPSIGETLEQICNPSNTKFCSRHLSPGVHMSILFCGSGSTLNDCGTEIEVPLGSVAFVRCWKVSISILTCGQDGFWHSDNEEDKLIEVCQSPSVNSQVCGAIPKVYKMEQNMTPQGVVHQIMPWDASIFRYKTFWCSATVISNLFVMTAGHCVSNLYDPSSAANPEEVTVQHPSTEGGLLKTKVESIYLYKDFNSFSSPSKNDVALLRLNERLIFSQFLSPACLHSYDDHHATDIIVLLSKISGSDNSSPHRLSVQKFVKECTSVIASCGLSNSLAIDSDHFCGVRNASSTEDMSLGGAALINEASNAEPRWSVTGVSIMNIFTECQQPIYLYSSVRNLLPWIHACIEQQKC